MTLALLLTLQLSLNNQDIIHAHSHLQFLSHDSLQGRKASSLSAQVSAHYIAEQFKQLQLLPVNKHYIQPFQYASGWFEKKNANNVMAIAPIIHNKPFIVISAHFDHLGVKGRKIFNGADDNASGVAALLTIAKRLMLSPERQLNYLFLATDAEEQGLFGARFFVDNPPLPLDQVLLNINLDMLGVSQRKRLLGLYNKPLAQLIEKLKQTSWHPNSNVKFTKGRGFYGRSVKHQGRRIMNAGDHSAFNKKGIAILYFGVGEHKHYHTSKDTYDNLDHQFFDANLHNIAHVISLVDTNYLMINTR